MNKRKTLLEKLTTGARAEGVKPNIPRYVPTGSKKLMRRLHEDDVEVEKFIGAIISALGAAASAAASAAAGAAGAVGGAVARGAASAGSAAARGASTVGRGAGRAARSDVGREAGMGALNAASTAEAPTGAEAPGLTPSTQGTQEEPEDEMEAEAQRPNPKVAQAVADIQALGKSMGKDKTKYRLATGRVHDYPPTSGGLLGPVRIDWKKKEHGEPTSSIEKEDGGGIGGDGGGTVFTSTNAGIFTPTHGRASTKPKKKKKSTGIERLGRFLMDGSPVQLKSIEKSAALNLVELLDEVRLDLRKEKKQVPYGSKPIEEDPPQMVERPGSSSETKEPKERVNMPKSDEELKRDKLMDENTQRDNAPYTLNLQQWGSGPVDVDPLKRGAKQDILTPSPESDEKERETTIPEDPDLDVVGTKGYEKYLKHLQKMEEEGDEFPLLNAFWKAIDDPD